jgi:hypothetical protein
MCGSRPSRKPKACPQHARACTGKPAESEGDREGTYIEIYVSLVEEKRTKHLP